MLCYVTDAQSLAGSRQERESVREVIRRVAPAGVDWIQIREKTMSARALKELLGSAVDDARQQGSRILVNDRLDVALAAGASGVHLGEQSLPLEAVVEWRRNVGRAEFLIGVSCHSIEAVLNAERQGADYVFFGPIFATPSKARFGAPQGIDRLREVCGAVKKIPVLAIGGITIENAHSCVAAGAAGIAAIRLFQESRDVAAVVRDLRRSA